MSFATPAQFLQCVDFRIVGQLVSDQGTQLTYTQLLTDSNLQAMLDQGAGDILSYATRGEIYNEDTLNNLTGIGQAFLIRLNVDLAFYYIVLRRGQSIEEYPQFKRAWETLAELANGKMVFNVPENAQDGHMQNTPISVQSIANNNFLVDNVYYFANRRFTLNQQ